MNSSLITFSDLKREIRNTPNIEHRYGRFLDLLPKYDKRGKDESWDLWYFQLNTEMCLKFAEYFLTRITQNSPSLNFDDLRMFFGSFCTYLYASLESFAHEINIFYEMNLKRSLVGIKEIAKHLKYEKKNISSHLQKIYSDDDFKMLFEYRNTIVHGYVYPILGMDGRLLLQTKPRIGRFSFLGDSFDTKEFCYRLFPKVQSFIKEGWKYFSKDELSNNIE